MKKTVIHSLAICGLMTASLYVHAYDGTNCKEPGVCWEPKPGYPQQVAGSKYDPKHDPAELNKQSEALKAMEARNQKRVAHLRKTGKFVYEVDDIE